MTTIYDVAKKAGVSTATVSKVVNKSGRISETTREMVLSVMKDLDYQPSVVASALTGKQTYTIGLLIPDLANPFFAEIARRIEDRGHEFGYNIVICSTDYSSEKESKYISLLKRKGVDGLIIASGFEDYSILLELLKAKFPLVVTACNIPLLSADTVALDDFMGGYLSARHLISLGHKNIAIIARDVRTNRERLKGFQKALEEHKLPFQEQFSFAPESNADSGKKITEIYLQADNPPTAIFACNDLLAIGAVQAIKEKGLSVPNDISVIGFDNTTMSQVVEPPLTTIAQPILEMGQKSMDLMIDAIKGEEAIKMRMLLYPELVIRQSTAVAKPIKHSRMQQKD